MTWRSHLTTSLVTRLSGATLFKMAKRNASFAQIVQRQFNRHLISRKNTDVVLTHLPGCIGN